MLTCAWDKCAPHCREHSFSLIKTTRQASTGDHKLRCLLDAKVDYFHLFTCSLDDSLNYFILPSTIFSTGHKQTTPYCMLVFLAYWTFKSYLQTTNSSRPPYFTTCSNAKIEYTAIHCTKIRLPFCHTKPVCHHFLHETQTEYLSPLFYQLSRTKVSILALMVPAAWSQWVFWIGFLVKCLKYTLWWIQAQYIFMFYSTA